LPCQVPVQNFIGTSFFFSKADPKGPGLRRFVLADFTVESDTASVSLAEAGEGATAPGGRTWEGVKYMAVLTRMSEAESDKITSKLQRDCHLSNNRMTSVELYWKSVADGSLHMQGLIGPGESTKLGTYPGHVFVWIALDVDTPEKGEIVIRANVRSYHIEEAEDKGTVHREL
jgi:hypothetical protein